MVETRVQQNLLRARSNQFAQSIGALGTAAIDRYAWRHVGHPVTRAEPFTQASLSALAVIVNGDIHALRDGKGRRISFRFIQEATNPFDMLDELRRRGRARPHPSVADTHCTFQSDLVARTKPDRW